MLKQVRQYLLLEKLNTYTLHDLIAKLHEHYLAPGHVRVLEEQFLLHTLNVFHAPNA